MKLGPSLHRIGNDIVAVYLVDTPEGVTVIDAGPRRALERARRRARRAWAARSTTSAASC